MTNRFPALTCAILILALSSRGVADDLRFKTNGALNGRWWAAIPTSSKIDYLRGMYDGLTAGVSECKEFPPSVVNAYAPKKPVPFDEIAKGVDNFYDEPANAAIPVSFALRVFVMKLNGATPDELAAATSSIRRVLARQ